MDNLEFGKEYLFSDDGVNWFKRKFSEIGERCSPYRYRVKPSNLGFRHVKPLREEKPERKLYTQSMKDAGKPIEVGMWFKTVEDEEFKCLLTPDSGGYICYLCKDEYEILRDIYLRPFPDPLELINGEAYEFEYEGESTKGIYREGSFNFMSKVSVEGCTNIKYLPLNY